MALPSSGQISLSQVAVELGRASNATTSLGESAVRSLAGVPSGAISLDNLHGKSAAWSGTITTNQQELNLRTWALANGWNGSATATVTINSGVYIWSDNTSVPALTVDGSWAGGLTIVNNGYVMGRGGNGGGFTANDKTTWTNGFSGGPAISTSLQITINNNSGYIGGGGGGGGAVSLQNPPDLALYTGAGGAGGGSAGGIRVNGSDVPNGTQYAHYLAGVPGASIGNSTKLNAYYAYYIGTSQYWRAGSSGGGRVLPAANTRQFVNTTNSYVDAPVNYSSSSLAVVQAAVDSWGSFQGGGQAAGIGNYFILGQGGGITAATNGVGDQGGTSTNKTYEGGSGGGWGASGAPAKNLKSTTGTFGTAGSGGKAINTNGNTITWVGGFPSSRVFGAVS